jgi:very-short-patch-repair endonuclease
MGDKDAQRAARRLAKLQHWVITRGQLLELGFTPKGIHHRIAKGRLYPKWAGVYAVDRPDLTREGLFMAAVLACGPGAVLSHISAAVLWGILRVRTRMIEVSVPLGRTPRRAGIKVHRRKAIDATRKNGIPVTSLIQTLLDLALQLDGEQYERAVNEAVNKDLIDPEELRATLEMLAPQPGIRPLRILLDRDTYVLTHTELEQRVVPIARRAGLGKPESQVYVNGRRADFLFRDAGIALEADSLRFHRTPAQQAKDTRREHAYAKADLLPLRFTHHQITFDPRYVEDTLRAVVESRSSRSSTERPNSGPTRRTP